ncbi:MAG: DUF5615 family PIN-like protein [Bacteroidota bacterium]
MKILLDENISLTLKMNFPGHEIHSVKLLGWAGKKNGELLGLMTFKGFEVLITHDKNLIHQQNLSKINILIIIISVKNNKDIFVQPLIEKVHDVIKSGMKKGVIEVS